MYDVPSPDGFAVTTLPFLATIKTSSAHDGASQFKSILPQFSVAVILVVFAGELQE